MLLVTSPEAFLCASPQDIADGVIFLTGDVIKAPSPTPNPLVPGQNITVLLLHELQSLLMMHITLLVVI